MDIETLFIDTIRVLSMDGVQKANSGHPGTPMALAPAAYLLYAKHLRHNPVDPEWRNRDRFVLSCGHASMLLYSTLHLSGYDVTMDDIRNFRQFGSRAPGHPEHGHTPGVETTTGPLGQGIANAVGMAIAEAHLSARFNRPGHEIVDHRTYVICSDGDMQEGISHEAAALAGHLGLGKIVMLYDDNHITIEGSTDLSMSENVGARYEAYGWHVQHISDINDLAALGSAIAAAEKDARPSLIVCRTHIGFGAPTKHDSAKAHGAPLGAAEIEGAKKAYGYPSMEPFYVSPEIAPITRDIVARGAQLESDWNARWSAYATAFPELAAEFDRRMTRTLPKGWDRDVPVFAAGDDMATRASSGKVLNAIAPHMPELVGGSADLAESTLTLLAGEASFQRGSYDGRNMHWGIREHGMSGAMNGMALHGGICPYGATFLIFSDYARPSMRLASLMNQPGIWVYTHDSIGVGEDGPTHQPVEQLAALRAIPGLIDLRPGDANEVAEAWRVAVEQTSHPSFMALTRQKVATLDRTALGAASGLRRGAYVLAEATGASPKAVIIASGSEVSVALDARAQLEASGLPTRVVSMPSWRLFEAQDSKYHDEVLPPSVSCRVSVEAASSFGWARWTGANGRHVGLDHFGASAPAERLYIEFGITANAVVSAVKSSLKTD